MIRLDPSLLQESCAFFAVRLDASSDGSASVIVRLSEAHLYRRCDGKCHRKRQRCSFTRCFDSTMDMSPRPNVDSHIMIDIVLLDIIGCQRGNAKGDERFCCENFVMSGEFNA